MSHCYCWIFHEVCMGNTGKGVYGQYNCCSAFYVLLHFWNVWRVMVWSRFGSYVWSGTEALWLDGNQASDISCGSTWIQRCGGDEQTDIASSTYTCAWSQDTQEVVRSHYLVPRVPQLLLQHGLALRKRAVGLTYASWLTSVEHSPL